MYFYPNMFYVGAQGIDKHMITLYIIIKSCNFFLHPVIISYYVFLSSSFFLSFFILRSALSAISMTMFSSRHFKFNYQNHIKQISVVSHYKLSRKFMKV